MLSQPDIFAPAFHLLKTLSSFLESRQEEGDKPLWPRLLKPLTQYLQQNIC